MRTFLKHFLSSLRPGRTKITLDQLTIVRNKLNEISRDVDTLHREIRMLQNHVGIAGGEDEREKYKTTKEFFKSRQLTILEKNKYEDINPKLRNLSGFIGKNHQHLHSTLEYFRTNWSSGKKNISISYKGYTNVEKNFLFQLCERLKNIEEIQLYRKDNPNQQVHIYANSSVPDVSFINGRWMEYYVGYRLNQLLINSWSDIDYEIIFNLNYRNDTGESHEIDIFLLLEGIPYIFESKSGKTTGDIIGQIKDHLRNMQIKADRHVVVLTKFAEKDIRKIRDNNHHQVISLNTFDEDVLQWFRNKSPHKLGKNTKLKNICT